MVARRPAHGAIFGSMGTLFYGDAGTPIGIEDRALAHLKVAIITKLRRGESFRCHGSTPTSNRVVGAPCGSIRTSHCGSCSMSPNSRAEPYLDRTAQRSANSTGGIQLIPEELDVERSTRSGSNVTPSATLERAERDAERESSVTRARRRAGRRAGRGARGSRAEGWATAPLSVVTREGRGRTRRSPSLVGGFTEPGPPTGSGVPGVGVVPADPPWKWSPDRRGPRRATRPSEPPASRCTP